MAIQRVSNFYVHSQAANVDLKPRGCRGVLIKGIESHRVTGHDPTSVHAQNAIWLQVSIAAEFLIFSARSPGL